MNPPWNGGVAWQHILHALKFAPTVVALAPLATLGGQERARKFWPYVCLEEVHIVSERQDYGGPHGCGSRDDAVFVLARYAGSARMQSHSMRLRFWP